jgi:hypothetical protein
LSTAILAPGCSTGPSSGSLNHTVCVNALYYTGSVTLPLYTPTCFEPPSSLSHFEDECYPTSGAPYGNDAYFVMSNAQGLGVMKRYLKPEERKVLCDIGYKVNSTYGSASAYGSFFNYGVGVCPGTSISGVNDGITATGSYAYIATVGGPAIPINNIWVNDPGANSFECLQVISGGGTVSSTSGTTFNFTPGATSGVTLLRYIPKSSAGQRGNITYVLVFTTNASACTSTACNLVSNGDFVQHSGSPTSFSQINFACGWDNANGSTADYYHTTGSPLFNIPCNIFAWEPDNLGLNGYAGIFHNPTGATTYEEIIYSKLSSPLLPNTTYQFTVDASLAEGISSFGYPLQVYFQNGYSPSVGMGAIPIADPTMLFTLATITNYNGWTPLTVTFTTGAVAGQDYIVLGDLTGIATPPIGTTAPGGLHGCSYSTTYDPISSPGYSYLLIDNVVLKPASLAATFTPPANVCINQTVTLNSYVSIGGGTFTGAGVTCAGTTCTFNPLSAGPGIHTITYTYTNSLGCVTNIGAVINVVNTPFILSASASPTPICAAEGWL